MSLIYSSWPFRPLHEQTHEEKQRWLRECHLLSGAETTLINEPHWCVVTGGPGSGKSAVMVALEQREAHTSLIVPYPPERWPGGRQRLIPQGDHLAQIMAGAGLAVRNLLAAHPEKIAVLTPYQREFVRWLLERIGGPRAFGQWLDSLDPALAALFQDVPSLDLYPTTTEPLHILGQIEGLVSLVRRWGYRRVLAISDLNALEAQAHAGEPGALFERLDLMHHPGFALVVTLPTEVADSAEVARRARGRINLVRLHWQASQIREIVLRHWRAALENSNVRWEEIVAEKLWQVLEQQWLLKEYEGEFVPGGWVAMSKAVLGAANASKVPHPLPVQPSKSMEIVRAFFAHHLPLRLDPDQHGVWRGLHLIRLKDQEINFLRVLFELSGRPVTSFELDSILGRRDTPQQSKSTRQGRIHTLVTRVRQAVEPFPQQPVYVLNSRGEGGYWLENFVK